MSPLAKATEEEYLLGVQLRSQPYIHPANQQTNISSSTETTTAGKSTNNNVTSMSSETFKSLHEAQKAG